MLGIVGVCACLSVLQVDKMRRQRKDETYAKTEHSCVAPHSVRGHYAVQRGLLKYIKEIFDQNNISVPSTKIFIEKGD